jgi:hypothetical protein
MGLYLTRVNTLIKRERGNERRKRGKRKIFKDQSYWKASAIASEQSIKAFDIRSMKGCFCSALNYHLQQTLF